MIKKYFRIAIFGWIVTLIFILLIVFNFSQFSGWNGFCMGLTFASGMYYLLGAFDPRLELEENRK